MPKTPAEVVFNIIAQELVDDNRQWANGRLRSGRLEARTMEWE